MAESRFSSKIIFEFEAYSLPRCLSESPFLPLLGRSPIALTFPDGPQSCSHNHCPARPPPPAQRPCPSCSRKGHFGMKCPSLGKERRCQYCEFTDHVVLNYLEMCCRYCFKKGHRARDCEKAAVSRAAKALRSSRPTSPRAAAAATRVHPPAA